LWHFGGGIVLLPTFSGCDFVGSNVEQANPDMGSSSEFLGSMTSVDFVKYSNPEPSNQLTGMDLK
jgi:hypothetical protein